MQLYLRNFIPNFFKKRLWGDRLRWGLKTNFNDQCWIEWEKVSKRFYFDNQRKGLGNLVNRAGYSIVSKINLEKKEVLEIGPGDIEHIKLWNKIPSNYSICDISWMMIEIASKKLSENNIKHDQKLLSVDEILPFEDESLDIVFSFFSLEHIYLLDNHLNEINRVLKKGGSLIGCIPTEGGLAWGLGRYLTSRRWIKKNTKINYDKVICWSHPNYADLILRKLDNIFLKKSINYYPFKLKSIDMNLVISFNYIKK